MDPNILKKIYKDSVSTKEAVESIDSTMEKLLKFQKKEEKEDEKYRKEQEKNRKRKEQLAKREAADKVKTFEKEKKETKEGKKSIGDIIKDALGGLVGGLKKLLGGIGGIITGGLGVLGGVLGGALVGAMGLVGGALGSIIGGAIKGLGKLVMGALKPALGLLKGGLLKLAGKGLLGLAGKSLAAVALPGAAAMGISYGAGMVYNAASDEFYGGSGSSGNRLRRSVDKLLDTEGRRAGQLTKEDKARKKRLKPIFAEIRKLTEERDSRIEEEATTYEKTSGGGKTSSKTRAVVDEDKVSKIESDYDKQVAALAKKYGIKFQNGGMIPTLLEPGEKVFMPGQWDANTQMLNSLIPRFQTGGLVEANHPDTGPGWSIGKDAQGRPSVFHKSAAQGLLDAIRDSNGAVKTSDITSSQRSVEKNRAVGGVPNSNHLTGYAVDIHGTSKAWLKANGEKYGWKNLVYSGHDGHFDFKGAPRVSGDGREKTADTDGSKGGGMSGIESISDIFGGGPLSALGGVGGFLTGMFEGLTDIFGDMTGLIFPGLSGGLMGGLGGLFGIGEGVGDLFGGGNESGGDTGGLDLSGVSAGGAYGKESLLKALDSAGITNKKERAMFLSQMHHESGGFRYREEIHDGSNYEGRSDLGNTQPGDGKRYKGRGYIQLTGRSNYRQYGKLVGVDLENNPGLAADPEIAAKVALAYWNKRVDRNAAQQGDVTTVTKNINGGTNGLQDRQNLFKTYSQQGYQTGGIVNMKGGSSPMMARMQAAQENFAQRVAEAGGNAPIIIFEDEPVPTAVSNPTPHQELPELPNGPSTIQAAEYFMNLDMGGHN